MKPSWLDLTPSAVWPHYDDEPNPFVRYRRLLWSWQRAIDGGWTDADYVQTVRDIDASIRDIDGIGFVVTPAVEVRDLAAHGAPARVLAKDETSNVAGSHKARHLMGLLLHLAVDAVANDVPLAIASCGNAALGAATIARAAGRPLDVFIPVWAHPPVVKQLRRLGARIHVCERRDGEHGDPCMRRLNERVAEGARAFSVQASTERWVLDGAKTIGWELAEVLTHAQVDHLFVQVGGGALLTSCAAGLLEARRLGKLDSVPGVFAVQSAGCAPFDRAWRGIRAQGGVDARLEDAARRAAELMVPWPAPSSAATGILDDETYDWLGVARALLLTGGDSIVATEGEVHEAQVRASAAGFTVDATGTAGYAGALAAIRAGRIDVSSSAAVLMTGVRR